MIFAAKRALLYVETKDKNQPLLDMPTNEDERNEVKQEFQLEEIDSEDQIGSSCQHALCRFNETGEVEPKVSKPHADLIFSTEI